MIMCVKQHVKRRTMERARALGCNELPFNMFDAVWFFSLLGSSLQHNLAQYAVAVTTSL